MLSRAVLLLCVITGAVLGATSALAEPTAIGSQAYILPENAPLKRGRDIWLENCENCHGYGTAGAPVPTRAEEWRNRVTKPLNVLYDHAIEGFIGEDYSMMPARGGNESLADEEVKSAVDYMVYLANFYIEDQQR